MRQRRAYWEICIKAKKICSLDGMWLQQQQRFKAGKRLHNVPGLHCFSQIRHGIDLEQQADKQMNQLHSSTVGLNRNRPGTYYSTNQHECLIAQTVISSSWLVCEQIYGFIHRYNMEQTPHAWIKIY